MISTNARVKDFDDVGLLFHAILRYAEANEERLDCSIVAIGYGTLLHHADQAAQLIAEHHVDEGDDWDGCVWLERLEDVSKGSLAESLFAESPDVESVVISWLSSLR